MNQYFELIKTKLLGNVDGFTLTDESESVEKIVCRLESDTDAIELQFDKERQLFHLYRGAKEDESAKLSKLQSYLFDEAGGDGAKEANSIANEFSDALKTKSVKSALAQRRRSDKASDESSAIFFVNRIPSVFSECREPLLLHKEHYEQLLPRQFCEEVVCKAFADALRNGEKAKLRQFGDLLSNMYKSCDLDTKSIIMQVILASVDERNLEYFESMVSEDLLKAWKHARKWYGKHVRPEKKSAFAKLGDIQARTLKD